MPAVMKIASADVRVGSEHFGNMSYMYYYKLLKGRLYLHRPVLFRRSPKSALCCSPGGGTRLYGLYGDVPLDRVWFLASLS